jgi:ribose 1,5-bisphosphokinase PhnN
MSAWMAVAFIACSVVNIAVEVVFYVLRRRLAQRERVQNESYLAARRAQLDEQQRLYDDFHAAIEKTNREFALAGDPR